MKKTILTLSLILIFSSGLFAQSKTEMVKFTLEESGGNMVEAEQFGFQWIMTRS